MRKILVIVFVMGCGVHPQGPELKHFTQGQKLGGKQISAETLEKGFEGYMLYCYACHGEKGDGKGPAAYGLKPPPRNFTLGKFKFGAVPSGQLPHDEDFVRIVKGGLHGTAMLEWDIPNVTLGNVIQYIKTFSPRWKDEEPGEVIQITKDPFGPARAKEAAELGKKVYHGFAQCWSCHPAYATKQSIYDAAKELRKVETSEFRDDMYHSVLKESDYGFNILPPDFTAQPLRSIRDKNTMDDLFRVIASGIGGTAMPQWKNQGVSDEQIWAMAWYVKSLMDLRDTQGAWALRDELAKQPEFQAPTPAPTPAPAPERKK
jgi:mono/diheme cytochrome c family protein/cytochrome c5